MPFCSLAFSLACPPSYHLRTVRAATGERGGGANRQAVSSARPRFYLKRRENDGPLIKPRIDLVVVLFHELDVARKLDGLRRLQGLVELFQHLLLVLRWDLFFGGDVGDLFLDRGRRFGEYLGFGVVSGLPHGHVPAPL